MRLTSRQALVAAMTASGLPCSKLAQMAGCSKSMIGHLRTGHIDRCGPRLANAIEIALLPVTDRPLFTDDPEPEPAVDGGRVEAS